ncbi:MAG TPA: hypothetical protein VGC21_05040 [Telluria sp.]|jgi:hypothetical protein
MENSLTEGLLASLEITQVPGRDLFVIARYMVPTNAYLAQGCLVAAGVPAVVADANLAQAYQLILPAMGGVRVLVPAAHIAQSCAVLEALARGDFEIDEDADVGAPE